MKQKAYLSLTALSGFGLLGTFGAVDCQTISTAQFAAQVVICLAGILYGFIRWTEEQQ